MVPTHTSQQPSHGLDIGSSKDVRHRVDHRQTQSVDTDPPFSCKWKIKQLNRTCRIKLHVVSVCAVTFAGGVQQCSLERDGLHVVQVFLDGHLDSEAGVRVHVRERQQVCGAHEEVPVESVDGQTCSQREIKVQFKTQ